MDVKQTKVASFFIDNSNEAETLAYIEKNAPLLKGYLLLFSHKISEDLQVRCQEWKLCFMFNDCGLKHKMKREPEPLDSDTDVLASNQDDTTMLKEEIFRNIRSGETIEVKGDLLIAGNINDGASVTSDGTLTIFGIIEGNITCNGSYLILSTCKRGKVTLNGKVINEHIQGEQLKMFFIENEEIKMKELQ